MREAPAGSEVRTSAGERFPLVDSMRAVAALSVLAFHVALQRPTPLGSVFRPYVGHLSFGITIFFLISGFLLYRPFLVARLEGRRPSEASYAVRRIARIVPAYWVALTLVALFGHAGSSVRADPLAYYGFAQIYSASTISGGIGQAWTLCVEMTFYVLLPLWALALAGGRVGAKRSWWLEGAALAALAAAGIAWTLHYIPQGGATGFRQPETIWLPRFLLEFAAGMGLAVLSIHGLRGGFLARPFAFLRRYPALTWIPAPILYVVAAKANPGIDRDLADTAAAACFLWPAIFSVAGRGVAGRVLAWRPLVFAGTVSYGVYLYHFAIITRVAPHLDSVSGPPGTIALLAISTAAALLVGWLSWILVERPAMEWARGWARRRRRGSSPQVP